MGTQVIFNDTLAGYDFVYVVGKEYTLPDAKARQWIKAGLCKAVPKGKQTADAKPPGKTADAKPPIKTADAAPEKQTAYAPPGTEEN